MQKWLTKMVRQIYAKMDTLFLQSPAFKQSVQEKGNFKAKYVYAPNWAEDLFLDKALINKEKHKVLMPKGFIVMFAGNVGAAQDFSKPRKRARLIDERDIDRHLAVRFYETLFDDDV